jgi:hypothetical protein
MNTVQYLNNEVDRRLVQKLFLRFANKYGNLWTSRLGENGDWKSCEDDWLEELSAFTVRDAVAAIKKALVIYKDYPPTQGQLIDLCLKESGVPSEDEIINMLINRQFDHPMVKLVYDKIGSWQLKNGTSEAIRNKTKSVYGDCLAKFKAEPEQQWAQLSVVKEQLSLPPIEHQKIPSPDERKGFKERMAEFQKLAEQGRAKLKDMNPIEFDEKKIRGEGEQRADYEKYLLSVPEHLVLGLPPKYAYDRQRLLNTKDTARHLQECGYIHPKDRVGEEAPRTSGGKPTRIYKNWSD